MAPAASAQDGSPAGPVPVEALARRRAALLEGTGPGVVVIRSADPRSIEGDYPQDSDYRENNDFFYLTGLESAGSWLVLSRRPGEADRATLYVPAKDPGQERWTGPKPGPDEKTAKLTGLTDVRPADAAGREIAEQVAKARAARIPVYAALKPAAARECRGARDDGPTCSPALAELELRSSGARDVGALIAQLRLVKDADELRRLRRAIEITVEAHLEAMRTVAPGRHEYEIEARIEYTFRRMGAERVGFPSIVGSGPNSTVLHYDLNRRRMMEGELLVVDIGAEFGYYTADITRTIPVSGRFSARQRALYDLVLGAQQAAIDAIRPGVTVGELNRIARVYMDRNSRDTCGGSSCGRYFVHGLSHWLGMDVHDVGDYATPLAPGMVLTIEPGIYIPEEAIGIRIEDDVLVTPTGHELLSGGAPRAAADIERVIATRAKSGSQ